MNTDLSQFIRDSLVKGVPREKIRKALDTAGWPADEIKTALNYFQDMDFPVPVPSHRPYLSAKETYMYLVMFLTLYFSAGSLVTLMFQYVDIWFPDVLNNYPGYNPVDASLTTIRWSSASLLIAFPIFLYVASRLRRAVAASVDKRTSKIRKWLTYLTLFIAAAIIIGTLISLLFNFLNGGLTTSFLLKTLSVLAVTGAIFGYYLYALRSEEK